MRKDDGVPKLPRKYRRDRWGGWALHDCGGDPLTVYAEGVRRRGWAVHTYHWRCPDCRQVWKCTVRAGSAESRRRWPRRWARLPVSEHRR